MFENEKKFLLLVAMPVVLSMNLKSKKLYACFRRISISTMYTDN